MRVFTHIHFTTALFSLLMMSILFSACKTQVFPQLESPSPFLSPSPQLTFKAARAESPSQLQLDFLLEINNLGSSPDILKLESWEVDLNGNETSDAFSLELEENFVFPLNAISGGSVSFPLTLKMDVASLIAEGLGPQDEYNVNLILSLAYGLNHQESLEVSGLANFPGVQAPEFHIGDIAILKAELINTRFKVAIKIVNPNPYPVELSAFGYELYGNGRFWADGAERNIIGIPQKSAIDGYLFMAMNFIDMDRNLLDQIINLIDVNYRFAGEAQVSTGIDYLPMFNTAFDLSGYSQVLEN